MENKHKASVAHPAVLLCRKTIASALASALFTLPLAATAAPIFGNYTQNLGTVTADAIYIGVPPDASQNATISGVGTVLILNGNPSRIGVGEQKVGTMTVSGGAFVDAAQNAAGCPQNTCNQYVGNGAGSTGTLTITGAGSRVDMLNNLTVGNTSVFPGFGTPGGTTTATLNVTNGGTLNGNYANIGSGPFPSAGNLQTGNERSIATAVVDGAGSLWNLVSSTVTGAVASLFVGRGPNTTAALDLKNGGELVIDGTPNQTGSGVYPGLSIARESGSNGTVRVDGASSKITIKGNTGFVNVAGASGSDNGTALLQVTNGGVISGAGGTSDFVLLNIGGGSATSGNGTVLIDGVGSRIALAGVFGSGSGAASVDSGAFVNIGRGSGTGSMTVSGGGALTIDTTGTTIINQNGPGVSVGLEAGSTGSLNIMGVGSQVIVTSDSVSPFMAVGRGGVGTLNVQDGGLLQLNGNGQSTVASENPTRLLIGGSGNIVGGMGTALVSGSGSRIELLGSADNTVSVGVGAGSNGSLTVNNGGSVSALGMAVGNLTGTGNLIVDNGTLNLGGTYHGGSNAGAGGGIAIGRGSGSLGSATLSNGAIVNITNDGFEGGMAVGGSRTASGGTGVVNMSGGSVITMSGNGNRSGLFVGDNSGVGTMNVTGPGTTVDVTGYTDGGRVIVASNAAAVGTLTVTNNAVVNAGAILGVGHDGTASTGGTGTLVLSSGGHATADNIFIGTGGVIAGNGGILTGNVVNAGGIFDLGNSPGQLTIEGGYSGTGKFLLEIASDGVGGFLTDSVIFRNVLASALSFVGTELEFSFLGDTDPLAFENSLLNSLATFFLFDNVTDLPSLNDLFAGATYSARADSYVINSFAFSPEGGFTSLEVSRIPEPGSLALIALAIGMLGLVKTRRKQRWGG
jgi:fibronectin-binding autotransporter adhesin